MGWFGSDSDQAQAYNQVCFLSLNLYYRHLADQDRYLQVDDTDFQKHSPSTAHELIGGAAAYEAMKAYENHAAKNGKPSKYVNLS